MTLSFPFNCYLKFNKNSIENYQDKLGSHKTPIKNSWDNLGSARRTESSYLYIIMTLSFPFNCYLKFNKNSIENYRDNLGPTRRLSRTMGIIWVKQDVY